MQLRTLGDRLDEPSFSGPLQRRGLERKNSRRTVEILCDGREIVRALESRESSLCNGFDSWKNGKEEMATSESRLGNLVVSARGGMVQDLIAPEAPVR